jgi:hypothetical protein
MMKRAFFLFLLVLATFLACGGQTTQQGAIVAVITTDLSTTELNGFTIEVSQELTAGAYGPPLVSKDFPAQFPASFTIAAGKNAHQMALVRVIGKKDTTPVVLREVEVLVPKDRVLALPMVLSKACAGQVQTVGGRVSTTCTQAHQSCQPATGTCGSSIVDDGTLAPYTGTTGASSGGPGGDAQAPLGPDEKEITSFILGGVTGTLSGNDIFVQLGPGANLEQLTPTIACRCAKIDPDPAKPQDFGLPVQYTASAQNGTSRVYTVHASVATSTSHEIISFVVTGATTLYPQLAGDNGLLLEFPFGSDVTHVTPTIAFLGKTIDPGNLVPQDFTNAVTYTVTAYDGSKGIYTVKAEIEAADTARIDSFKLNGVAGDVIPDASITVALGGVSLKGLVPEIKWIGGSIDPPENQPQDFTTPITYTVTSQDKSTTSSYVVTVKRPVVSNPAFSPMGGKYGHTIQVNITCATPNATVHYTTSTAQDPTESDPAYQPLTFTGPSVNNMINARCFAANYEPALQAKFGLWSVGNGTYDAPDEIDFGPTDCGATAGSKQFTLTNGSSAWTSDALTNFTISPASGGASATTSITVQPRPVPNDATEDIVEVISFHFPDASGDLRSVTLRNKIGGPNCHP